VLVHVTANAEWSNLPLSGLFVRMLERLTQSAGGLGDEAGRWRARSGRLCRCWTASATSGPPSLVAGVAGERLAADPPSAEMPPGIYGSGERRRR
jgi:hypothetical protein